MKSVYLKLFIFLILLFVGFYAKSASAANTCAVLPGGGNWNTASTWGGCGGTVPQAGDSVVATSSAGNLTVDVNTAIVGNVDFTGYTATTTINTGLLLQFGGNLTVGSGMKFSMGNNGAGFTARLSTGTSTIITNGVAMPALNVQASGTGVVVLADNYTTNTATVRAITLVSGTLYMDGPTNNSGLTHSIGILSSNNSNTRALYCGSSTINIAGASQTSFAFQGISGLTFSCSSATINMTGASQTFAFGSGGGTAVATFGTVNFTGGGTSVISNAVANGWIFTNLTFTGTSAKTDGLSVSSASTTITGALSFNGASSTTRTLLLSTTLGTAKTINLGPSANFASTSGNLDVKDIAMTGGAANQRDISAVIGLSGDAGGNSGLTFTTATTTNFSNVNGGNVSNPSNWSVRVPLPQDDCTFVTAFGTSKTITQDEPRFCRNVDLSGATFTTGLTFSFSVASTAYGSWTSLATSGFVYGGTNGLTFEGRSTNMPVGGWVITSNGKNFTNSFVFGGITGTYILADALSVNVQITFNYGDFNANNFNVTVGTAGTTGFIVGSTNATRNITMGTGTWTASGTGNVWNFSAPTGVNLISTGSTIALTSTSSTSKTFLGGGLTYNNLTITGGGTGAIIFTGSNTFNTLTINSPKIITLTSNTIQTVATLVAVGSLGNNITIAASTAGSQAAISDSSGQFCGDYLSLQDIMATGGTAWYAGANSANNGDNSGWIWAACGTVRASTSTDEVVRGGIKVKGGVKFH